MAIVIHIWGHHQPNGFLFQILFLLLQFLDLLFDELFFLLILYLLSHLIEVLNVLRLAISTFRTADSYSYLATMGANLLISIRVFSGLINPPVCSPSAWLIRSCSISLDRECYSWSLRRISESVESWAGAEKRKQRFVRKRGNQNLRGVLNALIIIINVRSYKYYLASAITSLLLSIKVPVELTAPRSLRLHPRSHDLQVLLGGRLSPSSFCIRIAQLLPLVAAIFHTVFEGLRA